MGLFYRFSGVTEEVLSEKDLLGTYKRVSISKKLLFGYLCDNNSNNLGWLIERRL